MANIRLLVEGAVSDYPAYVEVARRASDYAEEHEPGTLAFECFAGDKPGRSVWHETYTDADAFVTHYENLMSSGLAQEMMAAFQPDQMRLLTPVDDPRVQDMMRNCGALTLHDVAGFTRD